MKPHEEERFHSNKQTLNLRITITMKTCMNVACIKRPHYMYSYSLVVVIFMQLYMVEDIEAHSTQRLMTCEMKAMNSQNNFTHINSTRNNGRGVDEVNINDCIYLHIIPTHHSPSIHIGSLAQEELAAILIARCSRPNQI